MIKKKKRSFSPQIKFCFVMYLIISANQTKPQKCSFQDFIRLTVVHHIRQLQCKVTTCRLSMNQTQSTQADLCLTETFTSVKHICGQFHLAKVSSTAYVVHMSCLLNATCRMLSCVCWHSNTCIVNTPGCI